MNRWLRIASAATMGDSVAAAPGLAVPSPRTARDAAETRRAALALARSLAVPLTLFVIALAPRLSLGHSLDLITDEGVYIPTGRLDYTLLTSGQVSGYHWFANYEAPALPKLLMGWGSFWGAALAPGNNGWLLGARMPGIVLSAAMLAVAYPLARRIFGRMPAILGLLALALSPWVAYFSSIAYLDTYLLVFTTLAILLTWHAARRPHLFPLVGILLGLGFASKYTAALALVPITAYLIYYYVCVARCRPPSILLVVPFLLLTTIYLADPAIWADPPLLWNSIMFEYQHAVNGHNAFWAGQVDQHVPLGLAFYILVAKMSAFVTAPALLTLPWAVVRLARARRRPTSLDDRAAFALCWLGGLLAPFALLNIVVGTHYMLPLAPATTLVGAWSLWRFGRWAAPRVAVAMNRARMWAIVRSAPDIYVKPTHITHQQVRALAVCFALGIILLLTVPPLYGLVTIPQAEGYTSEWMNGENATLQVAYPAYADGVQWVINHSKGDVTVTLVSLGGGLDYWMQVRSQLFPKRVHLQVGTPWLVPHAQYVIWPMHLVQRQFPTMHGWQHDVVATIHGGSTTYCYILQQRTVSSSTGR